MIKMPASAFVLSILTLQGAARAQSEEAPTAPPEARRFGSQRTLAVSGDFSVALRHYELPSSPSYTTVTVRPTLDYFLTDHLSIGGDIGVAYSGSASGHITTLSFGPRVGYDIPLDDRFSVWSNVGVTHTRNRIRIDGIDMPRSWEINAVASADLVGQIAPHFFMGFGPYVTGPLVQSDAARYGLDYGLASTLGGWL